MEKARSFEVERRTMSSALKTYLIYCGAFMAFIVCAINVTILANLTMGDGEQEVVIMIEDNRRAEVVADANDTTLESVELDPKWSDTCRRLMSHENGTWDHKFSDKIPSSIANDPTILYLYFPEEIALLHGENQPPNFGTCTPSNKYLMYSSLIGHQCGCGADRFHPSHSVWVHNSQSTSNGGTAPTIDAPPKFHDYFKTSSTLRLARLIANANATICFVGDSVDYQIYMAMHNNLRRIDQLHRHYHPSNKEKIGLVLVVSREIPVVHSSFKAGNDHDWSVKGHRPPMDEGHAFLYAERPPPGGFVARSMHSILEFKAIFKDKKIARMRYYMSYGECH